jgi:hypothetical protein
MRDPLGRSAPLYLLLAVLAAALLLVACSQNGPLPTMAPAEATPAPPAAIQPWPALPPPAIIAVPLGEAATSSFSVPTGNSSSQVIIQAGAAGSALPEEVQRLLDDLASGALILNSSPAGQGGEPVRYA